MDILDELEINDFKILGRSYMFLIVKDCEKSPVDSVLSFRDCRTRFNRNFGDGVNEGDVLRVEII